MYRKIMHPAESKSKIDTTITRADRSEIGFGEIFTLPARSNLLISKR